MKKRSAPKAATAYDELLKECDLLRSNLKTACAHWEGLIDLVDWDCPEELQAELDFLATIRDSHRWQT